MSERISDCEVFKNVSVQFYACKIYLSTQVIGYAEIHLHASTTQPPPHTEDTVQYSVLDVALLSAASTTTPVPPVSYGERSQLMIEEEEPIQETDIHPLGKLYPVSSHTEHSFKYSYLTLYQIQLVS